MLRAVLFDMDGVLLKSHEAWFRTVEESGRRFRGRPITREEFDPTFGQGTAADCTVFGLSCSTAELDAFYVAQFPVYLDTVWVNPEAVALLEHLAAKGLGRALVTNTTGPLAKQLLEHGRLLRHLPVLATSDRVARAKPAPDLVQLALRELGVQPDEAVMVGDSRYDRDAARAASVRFIGLGIDGDERIERLSQLQR
ncbi:MAG: HAD family phosphatase [Archangiaceae bacterium]|nr:HAD family phosphatase [Archangiaceae bacterium]